MTLFWILLAAWIGIGILILAGRIYFGFWRQGRDFTVDDLSTGLTVMFLWPLLVPIAAVDYAAEFIAKRNGVLIPGSKSVKVERALKQ